MKLENMTSAQSEQRSFMLPLENKTRQKVKVQGWEGYSVNVLDCFKALVVCGPKLRSKKEMCTGRNENPVRCGQTDLLETRKKIDSELRCSRACPDVRVVGIRLSSESGYLTLIQKRG